MSVIDTASIRAKRYEVNVAYVAHGSRSYEYQKSFDELHEMNMKHMAGRFRNERGLPPNAKTPYCS